MSPAVDQPTCLLAKTRTDASARQEAPAGVLWHRTPPGYLRQRCGRRSTLPTAAASERQQLQGPAGPWLLLREAMRNCLRAARSATARSDRAASGPALRLRRASRPRHRETRKARNSLISRAAALAIIAAGSDDPRSGGASQDGPRLLAPKPPREAADAVVADDPKQPRRAARTGRRALPETDKGSHKDVLSQMPVRTRMRVSTRASRSTCSSPKEALCAVPRRQPLGLQTALCSALAARTRRCHLSTQVPGQNEKALAPRNHARPFALLAWACLRSLDPRVRRPRLRAPERSSKPSAPRLLRRGAKGSFTPKHQALGEARAA